MLGKRHMLRNVSGAIAIAASLGILFAPTAGAARAHSQACQDGGGWTTVIDDQGISSLVQLEDGSCVASLACADETATSSQYTGWVSVMDDNGVAWLFPAELSNGTVCALAAAAPSVVAGETPASPILSSPYPGWVFVTDDNGIQYLEPIALLSF